VRDDVGQLLWFGFEGTSVPASLREQLDAGAVGATILFKRNLVLELEPGGGVAPQEVCDLEALCAMTRELHRAAPDGTPALIAIDQEGGLVQRVRAPATHWPPMRAHDGFGPPEDAALAAEVGLALGSELRALGLDVDFAPVLDVHTNPANPVIGDRAFGTEPEAVARRALAFARGLHEAGLLACGKHFPGHGDTHTDSHLELPRVDHAMERLEQVELLPFARAAAEGIPMIMTAHVVFGALDPDRPATLSEAIVTGLLRRRLGYRGVIVSDDITMRAITDHMGAAAAAIGAVRAGCDVLLVCRDEAQQQEAEAGLIREAERDGELRRRIGESAARVRAMKRAHAENQRRRPAPPRDCIGRYEHRRLADRLAGR
jgi:beta-N-acetylhexosaminidase